jgi:hypothetical protein
MLSGVKLDGQIEGIVPHLVDGGLSIIWINFIMDHDLGKT